MSSFKILQVKKVISYGRTLARLGSWVGRDEAQGTTGKMYKIRLLSKSVESLTHPWSDSERSARCADFIIYCSYSMVYLFITKRKKLERCLGDSVG